MKRLLRWLKKYFIPHEHNDFKPHFLRHESMLFVFLVVIIVELGFLVQVFIVFNKTDFLAAVLPGILTTLTNQERAQNDAAPLVVNDLLTTAAQLKAQDMATQEYFAHTSPDGKTPWYWLDQVGYNFTRAGENLAVNFFESNDVAEAWMNSPTHRENIVKKDYTEIGIGVANGVYEGRSTVFVAQFFGTPVKIIPIKNTPVIPVKKTTQTPTTPKPAPKTGVATPPVVAVAPVAIQVLGEEINSPSNLKLFIQKVLASPREYLTYVYGGILLLIIFALLLILFIRSERTHPVIIARGLGLVVIIFFLLFINIKVLHLDPEVPSYGLSATVIAY